MNHDHRAQSFSNPPRQGMDPSQQQHQQQQPQQQQFYAAAVSGSTQLPRPSPFASSGPVAMVNQIRPGAPGQFPGVAVRSNPTQLATPLVATRRLSGATPPTPTGVVPPTTDSGSRDLLFPSPPTSSSSGLFDHATYGAAAQQQRQPPTFPYAQQQHQQQQQQQQQPLVPLAHDRFHSTGHIPAFQVQAAAAPTQAAVDLFPRVERASANTLVGASPTTTTGSPATRSFNQNFDNLFGSTTDATPLPPPPVRSTQSFSYGHSSTQEAALDYQQQQQQQPPRSFSQPPPPAAPFLGYADAPRSQSFRGPPSAATTPETPTGRPSNISPSMARPGFTQRSSSGSLPLPLPSPPRIHAEVRSADDLLEEFLHVSIDDQYLLGGGNGDGLAEGPSLLFPEYSSHLAQVPHAKRLTLADVPDTVEALEALYRQKKWKTLTKKSLSMLQNPSNDARHMLEIKSWWLAGLIKDGHYDNATSVLDQIGDLDDQPVAATPTSDTGDSFLSIRLRLLEAMLAKYKGNTADHEKKLFQLIARIRSAISQSREAELLGGGASTQTARKWLRIAQFTLVNHLVLQNKFSLAVRVSATIDTDHLEQHERVVVLSRFGRIHLQMGDLTAAENIFKLARTIAEQSAEARVPGCCAGTDPTTEQLSPQLVGRLLVNDGLLLFAQNKLQEALSAFDSALHLEATRVEKTASADTTDEEEELFLEEDLVCVAVNNFAICALYCCDVKGAVAALERMVRSNPARFLNAIVVFNLSSLYDLVFDNATSSSRKEMMKKLAEMYDLEHIDPAAFRI